MKNSGPGIITQNEGYKTKMDEDIVTRGYLKQGMGEAFIAGEQQVLELDRKGKLGKSYYDRPDKDSP